MKTNITKVLLSGIFLLWGFSLMAQTPPHPNTQAPILPHQHGSSQDQNAPVGSGTAFLLVLGAAYGAKKTYEARQKDDK